MEVNMANTMTKHYGVIWYDEDEIFKTKEEAIEDAKRRASDNHRCSRGAVIVYEALTAVKAPVPEAIVTELTS
jgi:hypothetical protein